MVTGMDIPDDVLNLPISKAAQRLLYGLLEAELQDMNPDIQSRRRKRIIDHISDYAKQATSSRFSRDSSPIASNSSLASEIDSGHRKFSLNSNTKRRDEALLNEFAELLRALGRKKGSKNKT